MIKINKIYIIDFNDLFILILYYLRSRQHTTAPFSDNRRAMLAMSSLHSVNNTANRI